MSKRYSASAGN